MPPKQILTKDMILSAAIELTKASGFESVNARSLAQKLGCSTRPIYSCYSNMDDLKRDAYQLAVSKLVDTGANHINSEADYIAYNMLYIQFAKNEFNLFKLIYLSNQFESDEHDSLIEVHEVSKVIHERLAQIYLLSPSQSLNLFKKVWYFMHGMAVMLATNSIKLEDSEIERMFKELIHDVVEGERRRESAQGEH
ncbi:TetR/AcrR family transcriptional regulator [Faecalispora jeddahensis]|uniref:TetR/AcrR family transcriptional regulator n=1 Tax=Faecalispora jeddahensis TaxID=1414721 RepID=UPI0018975C9D|nr:TetR/AcrR family transcriptional regulator [Faecalispora jeddahensis]